MDYPALRSEALALLGRLSGSQWSDHNIHDPGITILEQLCFAITDLAYRTEFPIEDLVATAGLDSWPPPRAQLLQGDPVTDDDLRKLLMSKGAVALRITRGESADVPLYFHERDSNTGRGDLLAAPPSWDPLARPINLVGLRQVRLQPSDLIPEVSGHLHRRRLLCEDLQVGALIPFSVVVQAELEVAAVDNTESLLAQILETLQTAITPAAGLPTPDGIRSSDLLHVLLDLPQVRAVRSISLSSSMNPDQIEPWFLPIPEECTAKIDINSPIKLLRNGLPLPLNRSGVPNRLTPKPVARHDPITPSSMPGGRKRELGRFPSLRRQLPAAYGVGPDGLASDASPERRA